MNVPGRGGVLALLVGAGLAWPGSVHPQAPPSFDEVTELLERLVEERTAAGAVAAVATADGVVYLEAVGLQDLGTGAPMTERSIFRIYSMAKPVTSVAVMMLWEEGRFELDDPVSMYLPEFASVWVQQSGGAPRPPSREITVRDLLLHTSGLSHRSSALYRDAGVRERDIPMSRFLSNLTQQPLLEDPGTRFRYSEATTVLGALVEVWSDRPFDVFLEERLFAPLGMVDTGFVVDPGRVDRFATVYGPDDDGRLVPVQIETVPFTERPELLEGAVGLVSTVPDYVRFSRMLLRGGELDGVRILEPETVEMITENGLPEEVLAARPGTMGWGLGNVNVTLEPESLSYPSHAGEYGWNGSAGTVFWVDPTSGTVIVLMTQSSPMNPGGIHQRVKALVHQALVHQALFD